MYVQVREQAARREEAFQRLLSDFKSQSARLVGQKLGAQQCRLRVLPQRTLRSSELWQQSTPTPRKVGERSVLPVVLS